MLLICGGQSRTANQIHDSDTLYPTVVAYSRDEVYPDAILSCVNDPFVVRLLNKDLGKLKCHKKVVEGGILEQAIELLKSAAEGKDIQEAAKKFIGAKE